MIKHWLFARAEKLLGRQLAESTAAMELLESLEGRSFGVHVEGLGLGCVLRVARGRILVDERIGGAADAEISGTPLDLIALLGPDMASRLPSSAARLTGVVHVAEKFAEMLRLARPDFEEELSRWVGDVAAHGAGRAARGALRWAASSAAALRLDTSEFLQEESRVVPGPYEVEAFCTAVERLRDDVDRAAARVERLVRLKCGE